MSTEDKHKQRKAVINRLSRIEGHVGSAKQMAIDERDCPDILLQIAASRYRLLSLLVLC